jgi:plasmid stabilization system protein ParE
MAYNISITDGASAELGEILDYIINRLQNPSAAKDFLDKVGECYGRLADNPKIYQQCDYENFKEKGYRKAVVKNFVIIYRIDEAAKKVYILHIFYGRQNYYSYI